MEIRSRACCIVIACAIDPFLLFGEMEVHVAPPVNVVISNEEDLRAVCATDRAIFACTRFDHETLECGCRQDGKRWRLSARASLHPTIYATDLLRSHGRVLSHEAMHVRDIASRLRTYLAELGVRRFDSESECRAVADAFADPANFHSVMNRFRHESNVKFQCVPPQEPTS